MAKSLKEKKKKIKKILKKLKKIYPNIDNKFGLRFYEQDNNTVAFFHRSSVCIHINLKFLKNVKMSKFKEVVIHEYAHYVISKLHQPYRIRQVHGKEWREVMFKLGSVKPRRTIDFSNSSHSFTTHFDVKCSCSTHKFTKNKLTRLRKGSVYICPSCKTKIVEI